MNNTCLSCSNWIGKRTRDTAYYHELRTGTPGSHTCSYFSQKTQDRTCPGAYASTSTYSGSCPNCGGRMHGDGHTVVRHCENVDPDYQEPDAPPVHCRDELTQRLQ